MRVGPTRKGPPNGFLPVFTVDTEEEARSVVAATCKLGLDGNYFSPELAEEQSLDVLDRFADRCRKAWNDLRRTSRTSKVEKRLSIQVGKRKRR